MNTSGWMILGPPASKGWSIYENEMARRIRGWDKVAIFGGSFPSAAIVPTLLPCGWRWNSSHWTKRHIANWTDLKACLSLSVHLLNWKMTTYGQKPGGIVKSHLHVDWTPLQSQWKSTQIEIDPHPAESQKKLPSPKDQLLLNSTNHTQILYSKQIFAFLLSQTGLMMCEQRHRNKIPTFIDLIASDSPHQQDLKQMCPHQCHGGPEGGAFFTGRSTNVQVTSQHTCWWNNHHGTSTRHK